jgi:hypothetical protein
MAAAFELLAAEIHNNGLQICATHCTFVSEDELAILSRLIAFQRPSQCDRWQIINPFQQALKRVAHALLQEGRRLEPRMSLFEAYADRGGCFRISVKSGKSSAPIPRFERYVRSPHRNPDWKSALWDGCQEPVAGSLKARALGIVRQHQVAPTALFTAAGISRQYLSLLCKAGFVERIGHGLYRYPERLRQHGGE